MNLLHATLDRHAVLSAWITIKVYIYENISQNTKQVLPVVFNDTGVVLGSVGYRGDFVFLLTGVAQVWDAKRYPLIISAEEYNPKLSTLKDKEASWCHRRTSQEPFLGEKSQIFKR